MTAPSPPAARPAGTAGGDSGQGPAAIRQGNRARHLAPRPIPAPAGRAYENSQSEYFHVSALSLEQYVLKSLNVFCTPDILFSVAVLVVIVAVGPAVRSCTKQG